MQKHKPEDSLDEQFFTAVSIDIAKQIIQIGDVSQQMAATRNYIDKLLLEFAELCGGNNLPTACIKGCHHCCSLPVEAPVQVIEDIALYLLNHCTADELQTLFKKLEGDVAQRKAPLMRAPCPLLTDSGRCSVYPVRPFACRAFTSTDVQQCIGCVATGTSVAQQMIPLRLYQAATVALQACSQKNHQPHNQVPLASALLERLRPQIRDMGSNNSYA